MKNIHMLPTNKPSSLIFDKEENRLLPLQKEPVFMEHQDLVENQNIYITSDVEIKEKCYVISTYDKWKGNGVLKPQIGKILEIHEDYYLIDSFNGDNDNKWDKGHSLKIILTTDKDLIKDGVQAVDDEFLEWFVNNPSCKSVEIEKEKYILQHLFKPQEYRFRYKINIPKKYKIMIIGNEKESLSKALIDSMKSFSEHKGGIKKGEVNLPNYKIIILEEEPKLETLEEAAERTEFERYGETLTNYTKQRPAYNLGFKNGTKWQQEQITIATDDAYSEGFENGKQYQAERSYSEEDMKKAFRGFTSGKSFKEWFEQFKKK